MNVRLLLTAVLAVAVVSCATVQQTESLPDKLQGKGFRIGEEVKDITNYTINGWNYVDRENLILKDGASRHYLVTFKNTCHGLPGSEIVAYTSINSRLTRFDKFVVRDRGSKIVDHCYIDSLHRLEKVSS